MAPLFQALLILHVLAAMYWFGATASIPRRLRAALESEIQEARRRMGELAGDGSKFAGAGILVFLSGLGMALLRGFAHLHPRLHAGLGLTVVWLIIGLGVLRPTMQKIGASLKQGDSIPESALALRKRVAMLMGIQHLLFTVITILMLWRV